MRYSQHVAIRAFTTKLYSLLQLPLDHAADDAKPYSWNLEARRGGERAVGVARVHYAESESPKGPPNYAEYLECEMRICRQARKPNHQKDNERHCEAEKEGASVTNIDLFLTFVLVKHHHTEPGSYQDEHGEYPELFSCCTLRRANAVHHAPVRLQAKHRCRKEIQRLDDAVYEHPPP